MMPGSFIDRNWRRLFVLAVALLVIVTGVKVTLKALKPGRTGEQSRTAFLRWRPQIEALHRGEDVYRSYAYPNPPIMALVLSPFAALSPMAGLLTWFVLKVGMAVMMAVWCRRLIDPDHQIPDAAFCIAFALGLHPILGDLSHGNVNLFIAFLVFAGLECYRTRRDLSSGVLIALAICCKVTPALFVPYFLWKRAWKTLVGIAIGLLLGWVIIPGAVLGFEFNSQLLASWFDTMVKPFVLDGRVTSEHPNQSLPGVLTRLFTNEPSFLDYAESDGRPIGVESHSVVNLGSTAVAVLVKVAMLGFVLMMALRMRTGKVIPRQGLHFAAECGCVLLGMLLFSERTWKHHAVTLLLPIGTLCAAFVLQPSRRLRLLGILSAVPLLSLMPSLFGERTHDLAQVYGVFTLQYLLLLVGLFSVMRGNGTNTTRPVVVKQARVRKPRYESVERFSSSRTGLATV